MTKKDKTKTQNNIDKEYLKLDQDRERQFQEMDRITKMLIRRDLELSEVRNKRETELKELEQKTKDIEDARRALVNMLEDTEEARAKLGEEESKIRSIIVSLADGIIVFNKEEEIILVNPEAENILETKAEQILNKKTSQISGFANLDKLYQVLGKKIEWTGQKYELAIDKPLKRFFQVSVNPFLVKQKIMGMIVVLHDVTRDKEIDKMKTEFVSIAAHQLRTPLSAIKWTLKMLLDGDVGKLSKEQVDFLDKGYQSNERMIALINDLLNVARIEEGRYVYNPTVQSLEKIIEEVVDSFKDLIKRKKIKLIFKKPKGSLPKVKIDREKLGLVIQNLMDNAIRLNKPNGEVTVLIDCDKIDIKVMIKDTGIGIPALQQERIFTKFFRADNAIKSEAEGTGLGLFIAKNIIKAHGGKIWFESKEGEGSTFWFTVPIKS